MPANAVKAPERAKHADEASTKLKARQSKRSDKQQLALAAISVFVGLAVVLVSLDSRLLGSVGTSEHANYDKSVAQFLDWFEAAGGSAPSVGVARFPDMGNGASTATRSFSLMVKHDTKYSGVRSGVIALQNISEDEQLLFVPNEIIICRDTIARAVVLTAHESAFGRIRKQEDELLTAFLILEQQKGEASRWFPYIQLLPSFTGSSTGQDGPSPLFFRSMQDIHELQDERIIAMAREERDTAQQSYQRFMQLFRRNMPSSIDDRQLYLWARFLVNSRAFSLNGKRYLVPFADFFNGQGQQQTRAHDNGQHFLRYHVLQGAGMTIKADRATPYGHQVFEDYGDDDNYVYFLYHGFLMSDNAFDCAAIRLPRLEDNEADTSDVREQKNRVLQHFHIENGPLSCITADGSARGEDLVRFYMTLSQMGDEEMAMCDSPDQYARCFLKNEPSMKPAIVAFKQRAVHAQLEAYPTTLDEDLALMTDLDFESAGKRVNEHAVRFRVSRKRILHEAYSSLSRQLGESTERQATPEAEKEAVEIELSPIELKLNRFLQWVSDHRFPVNHLELKYVSEALGFGTFATKPLANGEVYLSVPVGVVINEQSALQSAPWIREVAQTLDDRDGLLLLHLLDEKYGPKRHESRWLPYLDMLPALEDGRLASPLFYPDDGIEMELLRSTDLNAPVQSYRRKVQAHFEDLESQLEVFDGQDVSSWITSERFLWANAILDSRSIWWSGQRHLVPLLDMVNCQELGPEHAAHHTLLDDSGRFADTKASWTFAPGDQVVENYGQPNYIYLLYHGFVLEAGENSHDCAHFHVDLSDLASPQLASERETIITQLEALEIYAWEWDLCVATDDAANVDRFMRMAWLALNPKRAMDGVTASERAEAALELTKSRVDRLNPALQAELQREAGSFQRKMIRSYMTQQLLHLHHLSAHFKSLM